MKRVLGLDLGTKTLGIAISDSLGIAHGRENFRFQERAYRQALNKVKEVLEKEGIDEIALGYPLNMDGSAGERAKSSERFKAQIEELCPNVTVYLVDERLTTVMATQWLYDAGLNGRKRHEVIDQQSAVAILESHLRKKEMQG